MWFVRCVMDSGCVTVVSGGINFSVFVYGESYIPLCTSNERNGWRGKSCERVGSFCIRC